MERVFTKSIGRWSKGLIRDWPPPTWAGLARNVGEPLEAFSAPIEMVAATAVGATPTGARLAAAGRRRRR